MNKYRHYLFQCVQDLGGIYEAEKTTTLSIVFCTFFITNIYKCITARLILKAPIPTSLRQIVIPYITFELNTQTSSTMLTGP